MMFVPAATLIVVGIAISVIPSLRATAESSAKLFADQTSYTHAVLDNATMAAPAPEPQPSLTPSLVRSSVAAVLALLLALATVFRKSLGQTVQFARALELGSGRLREAHSGHPGDYIAWLTFGTAVVGGLFAWFLR